MIKGRKVFSLGFYKLCLPFQLHLFIPSYSLSSSFPAVWGFFSGDFRRRPEAVILLFSFLNSVSISYHIDFEFLDKVPSFKVRVLNILGFLEFKCLNTEIKIWNSGVLGSN